MIYFLYSNCYFKVLSYFSCHLHDKDCKVSEQFLTTYNRVLHKTNWRENIHLKFLVKKSNKMFFFHILIEIFKQYNSKNFMMAKPLPQNNAYFIKSRIFYLYIH